MAEEPQTATPTTAAEEVVVSADPPVEKITEKEPPPAPEAEEKKPSVETLPESDAEKKKPTEEETITQSDSFKEESNRVADLQDPEKKAVEELKQLIQQALNNHEFTSPPPAPASEPAPAKAEEEKAPAKADEEKEPAKAEEEKSEPPAPEKPETEEPTKPESDIVVVADENPVPPPPATTEVTVVEVLEMVVVDDDGAKTVEAIEETVVAVAAVTTPPTETDPPAKETEETPVAPPEEVFIWGIPLIGDDEKSDVVLLKFLRARDFKAKEAFAMIKNTVQWRKEFGIEKLVEEDLGNDLDKVVFMHGFDREGHPVCYNVFGEFQNKELYQKTFSDEEKGEKFLRWRIQFLEKGIRHLDFRPDGINTFVQVTDLRNSPGLGKRVLRQAMNRALSLLQDNYPEFVAKQILINVPWWYLAFNRMISPFMTQRTKSKFVYAGPSKSSETLFRYIAPEQIPVQYGGLSKENDDEFTAADAVTDIPIKAAAKQYVEIPVSESCLLVWELRVIGWDVTYTAEFVPSAEEGYTVIVQKSRKMISTDEPILKNSFKIGEPGKVVLTIDNTTSKKKKLLYRSKTKSSSDCI